MAGIVTNVSERQAWTGGTAQRVTDIQGADLGYFFATAGYYNLTFLFGNAAAAVGGVGMLDAQNKGLIAGTPASLAKNWYTNIMAGDPTNASQQGGILSTTTFNVANGQKIPFSKMLATWFEEFDGEIEIPTGANFLSDEGTWFNKLSSFLQWPWYEFFINTTPSQFYPSATGGSVMPPLDGLFPNYQVTVVGRVNPLPHLVNAGTPQAPSWSMDVSRWNALPNYTLDNAGFYDSVISFSPEMVRNFYMINPLSMGLLTGSDNSTVNAFVTSHIAYKDQSSVNGYGYRPQITETQWLYDPAGIYAQSLAAQGNQEGMTALYNDLLARVMSMYEPGALMANATVVMPMRPDIVVGTTFTYVPFKDNVPWMFYVEGVTHSFTFPQSATTTLRLSRGLPQSVYQDAKLLTAIHLGTAMKQNGNYVIDPNASGITTIEFSNAASVGANYSTPQGGKQPGPPTN
ncbi:hypothetical protein AcidC75_12500 [Acidisoma sp. C75]